LPDVSPKLVHRHRFTRATATLATHHESELGRQLARRRVVTLLNVGRNAFGVGPIPEVANRGVHRLAADPLIAPFPGDGVAEEGRVYRANPKQAMPRQTIHRWWYEHLQRAGLVAKDVERGALRSWRANRKQKK
jgi:hypothetical protein